MKKTKAALLAALLCTSMAGCGNNVNVTSETTYDTTVSETVSTSETTTIESETITAEETTAVTEPTAETAEITTAETTEDIKIISPSGWVLDKEVIVSEFEDYSLPEIDEPVLIAELANENNIYGVCVDGLVDENGEKLFVQYTIIEHDGIADEFERECFGRFGSQNPLECELINIDDDDDMEIFTRLYIAGGTMCCIYDMAVFDMNESGHYEMVTIDIPYVDYDPMECGFGPKEKAFADEMISKINAEWADDNETVRFFTDTSECTAAMDKVLFGEYSAEDFKENMSYISSLKGYGVEGDALFIKIAVTVGHPDMFMPDTNCVAKGKLIYSDGGFTLGDVELCNEW